MRCERCNHKIIQDERGGYRHAKQAQMIGGGTCCGNNTLNGFVCGCDRPEPEEESRRTTKWEKD